MQDVQSGIYRLGAPLVNWFLLEEGGAYTVVDAGNPDMYDQLPQALASLGGSIESVEAVVLTHAHGDHLGSSARIEATSGARVHLHEREVERAAGRDESKSERHPIRDVRSIQSIKMLWFFLRGGALKAPPVLNAATFGDGDLLDVPGGLRVLHMPGHTPGSCALFSERRRAVFTGDSLVTLNLATWTRGPQIMPGSFNMDSARALGSLGALDGLDAEVVLPGHGEPWRGRPADAAAEARRVGRT